MLAGSVARVGTGRLPKQVTLKQLPVTGGDREESGREWDFIRCLETPKNVGVGKAEEMDRRSLERGYKTVPGGGRKSALTPSGWATSKIPTQQQCVTIKCKLPIHGKTQQLPPEGHNRRAKCTAEVWSVVAHTALTDNPTADQELWKRYCTVCWQ